jgi:hypothetical protein
MTTPGIADRMSRRLDDSPLYQLVKLKLHRILYSASADSEDMDAGIGVALTVLTLPGAFLSLLLFNKYGSLLRFLRGQVRFDPYAASLPDEYLFIVLAMLVSGGVALWKWDTVFPDRRDMFNVVPLPVHIRQIFLGSLLAILLFGAIFCIDVNAGSAVLFPLVVSASQESFLFFGKIALGHGLAIVTASLFTFAAVFAIAGVFMAALPARIFYAVSLYIRAAIAITLLIVFSSAFTVSQSVALGTDLRYSLLRYLPSIWFLGTCQWARGVASAAFRHFAFTGFIALILTSLLGSLAYGLAYRRHFNRIVELSAKRGGNRSWGISSVVGRILDRTILRTPFEQAAFRFTVRTLAKSDRHRAALAVFAGIGFVAASQYLSWSGLDRQGPMTAEFAAPLIVLYCCILGIRYTFDLPVELNANWIFRFLIPPTLDECALLAGKAIFLLVLPLIVVVSILFLFRWGVTSAALEFLLLTVWSATLTAGLVLSFRKLPFTCAKAGFQQNALLKLLVCILGVSAFALLPAGIEHWASSNPLRLLILLPLLALVWWAIYEARSAQLEIERQIVFQDSTQNEIELLKLNA